MTQKPHHCSYIKGNEISILKRYLPNILTAELFTIMKIQSKPKCQPMDEYIFTTWYICKMKHYSVTHRYRKKTLHGLYVEAIKFDYIERIE